jgi:hypothetical protein
MMKLLKREYTVEFKELAVKRVKAGQSAGAVAKDFGLIGRLRMLSLIMETSIVQNCIIPACAEFGLIVTVLSCHRGKPCKMHP